MTCAIIVLYKANEQMVSSLYESLISQIDKLILVKNDDTDASFIQCFEKSCLIDLGKNYGIAYAQNCGIEEAVRIGADWILFSDQDTVYPENFVCEMLEIASDEILGKIGALTPIFYDEIKQQYSKIMVGKTKAIYPKKNKIYQITHAISSGTLVPVDVIKKCGGMKDDLFIDFVDYEWCWRVLEHGYKIYCFSGIEIHHQLGDKLEKRFGMKIVSRSLFRFYYIIRNGYYLLTTDYLKGKDHVLFRLLMWKKIFEALVLNYFKKTARVTVRQAVRNGKNKILKTYE